MNNSDKTIKYILYARKSTETEDKQVASIEDQIKELGKIAKDRGLNVVKTLTESYSAKNPGQRPVFNEMINMISTGKANGILCWKINRLARNPVDGGQVSWMLQKGIIQCIQTYGGVYKPTDNVLMMAVELGMANQFLNDLSVDTKRGLRNKAKKGWYPGVSKPGYINNKDADKGYKVVFKDEKRYNLLKKAFDHYLTGLYSPKQILDKLNNDWGYRTKKRRKLGGKPMALSTLYNVLADPFYAGKYEYPKGSGNWYEGKHKPMITEKQHQRILEMLGRSDNPRPTADKCDTAIYGLFKCGECGSAITPDEKIQTICTKCKTKFSSKHATSCPRCGTEIKNMKNPKRLNYVYYRCGKKKNPNCKQGVLINTELEKQISKILNDLAISENMKNWYIKRLNEFSADEVNDRRHIYDTLQSAYSDCQKRMDNLLELKISPQNTNGSLLPDNLYIKRKNQLTAEMSRIKEKMDDTKDLADKWMDMAVNTFNFACYAQNHFLNGDIEKKKRIILGLGANLIIMDKKVFVSLPKHLELIKKANEAIKSDIPWCEPKDLRLDKEKTGSLEPVISKMLPGSDSNRRPIGYTYPLVT
jgi:site-specific DNA recombinase